MAHRRLSSGLALVSTALLLAFAVPATTALGADHQLAGDLAAAVPGPAIPDPIRAFLHCLGAVGLSDQQKADAKTILEAGKPVLEGLHQQVVADRKAVADLLGTGSPDPCAVGSAVLRVGADRKAVKDELVKIGASLEALLTADQKTKFEGCLAGTKVGTATPPAGQ